MSIKVLSIGSDRKLFENGSVVSERIKEYGSLVEELHIVVFALKLLGLKEKQLTPNIWIYPTNSSSRLSYVGDAAEIGKQLVLNRKFVRGLSVITTQDPFECGLAGLRIKNKWHLPLEVQLHTDPFSPYFLGFLNTLRKRIAKKVLRNAESVRVVTAGLRSKLASYAVAKISVLPIYVDREPIENAKLSFDVHARYSGHFIILCVARLEPEKNLELALQTLSLVRKTFTDVGMIIVGSGREESHLKSYAKKLGL